MKTYLYLIMLTLISLSCETGNNIEEDSVDVETYVDQFNKEEQVVVDQMISFWEWYLVNQDTLYRKRERVIGRDDDFYYLDNNELTNYLDWLEKLGYFSTTFIQKEETYFLGFCSQELDRIRNGEAEFDEENPCSFIADVFIGAQDNLYREEMESFEYVFNSLTDDFAQLEYKPGRSIIWVKEHGVWKMNDWPIID